MDDEKAMYMSLSSKKERQGSVAIVPGIPTINTSRDLNVIERRSKVIQSFFKVVTSIVLIMEMLDTRWIDVFLNMTQLRLSGNIENHGKYLLQWHTAASTLYIVHPDKPEIDIRIDREVFKVQVCILNFQST